jgi:hypothetical protein
MRTQTLSRLIESDLVPESVATTPKRIAACELSPELRQFASLCAEFASRAEKPPSLLFASASAGTPSLPLVHSLGRAINELYGSRIAIVSFSEESRPIALDSNVDAPIAAENWTITGNNEFLLAFWNAGATLPSGKKGVTFSGLITQIRDHFDLVLVETGEVLSATHTTMVAASCSGIVLLIRPGVTTIREIQQSKTLLARTNSAIIGCAFVEAVGRE